MTIQELIDLGVTEITHPSWTVGHLHIEFDRANKKWFMLFVENETGRRYLPERGDRQYYLKFSGYEEYREC